MGGDDVDAEGYAHSKSLLRRKLSVGSDVRQFSKNIAGRAMVCTSVVSASPRELSFGNCNIGESLCALSFFSSHVFHPLTYVLIPGGVQALVFEEDTSKSDRARLEAVYGGIFRSLPVRGGSMSRVAPKYVVKLTLSCSFS